MKVLWRKARIKLLAVLGFLALTLLYKTVRWEYVKLACSEAEWPAENPRLFLVWHGRQIMMPALFAQFARVREVRPVCTLASKHSDGQIIAGILKYFGFASVAGSSSRGGVTATRGLLKKARAGFDLAITPDGPRGPRHELKGGAVDIAKLLGATIYPVAFSADRYWQVKSWDRMIIPRPFTRVVGIVGEPVNYPSGGERELFCDLVQSRLNAVTEEADSYEYS